jgi:formylglycine-generating enzyme
MPSLCTRDVWVVAVAAWVTACGLTEIGENGGTDSGVDGAKSDGSMSDGGAGGGSDGPSPVDGPLRDATRKPDAPSTSDAHTLDAPKEAACPSTRGPAMVPAGAFCIDSTEVTTGQYAEFLDAGYNPDAQPSYCSWNTGKNDYVPSGQWPSTEPQLPVTSVDWCDAYAFCAWAGKRLCGQLGGGAVDPDHAGDASADQWLFACSKDGTLAFPYGNSYVPELCNDDNANCGNQVVDPVKSFAGCVGGYLGLYDMSGNVREWEDSCDNDNGRNDNCNERGGSVNNDGDQVSCGNVQTDNRDNTSSHVGFRCCSP